MRRHAIFHPNRITRGGIMTSIDFQDGSRLAATQYYLSAVPDVSPPFFPTSNPPPLGFTSGARKSANVTLCCVAALQMI